MKKLILRLFGIEEQKLKEEIDKHIKMRDEMKKQLEESKTLKESSPVEFIRQMTKKENEGAGTCEKYLGSVAIMEKWYEFYKEQEEQINFIKYMQNIDGIDMYMIFESLGAEFEQKRINDLMKTTEGRRKINEERRKTLAS